MPWTVAAAQGFLVIVVVTGGRDYRPTHADAWALKHTLTFLGATKLRHGGCRGVDEWAGRVAARLGLPVEIVPADWDGKGKEAGPLGNRAMMAGAGALVAFPGGRGTQDCIEAAWERRVPVMYVRPRVKK